MNVKVVPYEVAHAYEILDKIIEEEDLQLSKFPDWDVWVKSVKDNGPAYTLFVNDEIVGCAGVILLGYGKGEAWMLRVSSRLCKCKKTAYKIIKEVLPMIIKANNLKRVQALIKPDFDRGKNLAKHLGFKNETPEGMEGYGPNGETFLMYAKIRRTDG